MPQIEILNDQSSFEALKNAQDSGIELNITYQVEEKWKVSVLKVRDFLEGQMRLESVSDCLNCSEILKKDQPVGMSFKMEHSKYVFHSKVIGCDCQSRMILVDLPEKMEKLPRRSYIRVATPKSMVVKVIFWHRGYDDDKDYIPVENVWQGRVENLSAGGMKILIESEKMDFFSPGQIIGLQFTPMPYERPILLEGLVRHLEQAEGYCEIGVEFLGLEASWTGSEKREKLLETVEKYGNSDNSAGTDEGFHED